MMAGAQTQGRQIVDAPLAHYRALYEHSDAAEIAARTGLPYDAEARRFEVVLFGKMYYVNHPVSEDLGNPYEEILLLRYLLEGKYAPFSGAMLAYEEMPWGPVYINQFKGRVLGRAAREFGRDPASLGVALSRVPGLAFERLDGADAAFRFEFLPGFFMSILLWAGDEEFPPSAQVLFSDNFKYAFTAEDMAASGDVVISRLKRALKDV